MPHEDLAMNSPSLREAIFRLGRISVDRSITNESLLRRLAEVVAQTLEVHVVALGVFEEGVEKNATACFVHSPWTFADSGAFQDQAFWSVGDRELALRLASLRRGRVYHRLDLVGERDARPIGRVPGASSATAGLDDQALALFRRRDGAELLVGINSPAGSGPLNRATLARTGALAPYVAQCWAVAWRKEPEWMRTLKPQARDVLERLLQGFDDDQIALRAGLSYHSVRAHLKRMFRAAGVRSRLHLMQACQRAPDEGDLIPEAELSSEPASNGHSPHSSNSPHAPHPSDIAVA